MKYVYILFRISFVSLSFFLLLPLMFSVYSASLRFNPVSSTLAIGSTVSFDVVVDTGGENVTSADAFILYDSSAVQIVSVTEGTFFPSVTYNTDTVGKVYIAGVVTSAATYKNGQGVLTSVTVKGLQNKTVTLRFDCTQGSTIDSNIAKNDVNATDIIVCSENNSYELTIGSGSPTNQTVTPQSGGSSQTGSSVITPTALPQTGTMEKVAIGSLFGLGLLIVGGLVKMFL